MPERATIAQTVQIGAETTPGTSVAAGKKLQSLMLSPRIQANVRTFRGSGFKYPSLAALGKEWSEWGVEGPATYTELVYILNGLLSNVTPSTVGTGGQSWAYAPSSTVEDTIKTYTMEHGSSVRAMKAVYGLFTGMDISWNRDEVNLTGAMIARAVTDGITMTAAPTLLGQVPILGQHVTVYIDTTSAGLGVTKLNRHFSGTLSIGNRFGPVWVVDSAQASYVNHVELEPAVTLQMRVEADTEGMAFLTNLRASDKRFIRVKMGGAGVAPNIGAGADYLAQFDLAAELTEVSEFQDEEGVYAIDFTWTAMHDATWGKALAATVVNTQATL